MKNIRLNYWIVSRRISKCRAKPCRGRLDKSGGRSEEGPRIVRTKRFTVKPMAVDEAVMQMNLLGHSFFVFTNAETEDVNVVYRRKDGNYGLIDPYFE